ncbi:MAG: hypothetical protein GXO19_02040 [Epsilonproteobacteria bacterium]|nr:hypothetical protein [Campylobacterota bacterium]NPA56498.1 hypothetical protein [Campylobacterota bacterium]
MFRWLLPLFMALSLSAIEGVLIPFYHYPTFGDREIERLIQLKRQYPSVRFLVIINPNNGHFRRRERNFARMIELLSREGIEPIGYIYSSYGKRPLEEVVEDIESWAKFYKPFGIEGIFIDEVDCTKEEYYRQLQERIKRDFSLVVANPGIPCRTEWSDIGVVHENSNYSIEPPQWEGEKAVLIHSIDRVEFDQVKGYDFIYITPLSGTNPWERLSPFLPELLSSIEREFQRGLNKK